jgi:hypothetical protein
MSGIDTPTFGATGCTLNGTSEYLKYTAANWRSSDSAGTISLWLQRSDTSATTYVLFSSADEGTDTSAIYILLHSTYYIRAVQRNAAGAQDIVAATVTQLNDTDWHHVAVTSNGTAYKIYVDGSDEGALSVVGGSNSGDWFADTTLRDNVTIGTFCGSTCPSSGFSGTIFDAKVWDHELSAAEITGEYNDTRHLVVAATGQLYQGLVLDVPMTSGWASSSTVANDRAPEDGRDTLTATGTPPTFGTTGTVLDGAADYLLRNESEWRNSDSSGTFSLWFKNDSAAAQTNEVLFGSFDTATDTNYMYLWLSSGALRFSYRSGAVQHFTGSTIIEDTDWHHVALVSTGTAYALYLDGVDDTGSGTDNGNWLADIAATRENIAVGAFCGATCPASYYGGTVQGFRYWNLALSATEVASVYAYGHKVNAMTIDDSLDGTANYEVH